MSIKCLDRGLHRTCFFLILALIIPHTSAAQHDRSYAQAAAELRGLHRLAGSKWSAEVQDRAFENIKVVVRKHLADDTSEMTLSELLVASVAIANSDKSLYIGELLLPLWKVKRSAMSNELDSLPQRRDADRLRSLIENAEEEERFGNG